MKNIIFTILFLFSFIDNKIPDYFEIKREGKLDFKLANYNSSIYAYLNCSNDYEPDENITSLEHYLLIGQNIKFKYILLHKNSYFPDESEFNKNSTNISEPSYIDIDKNIILGSYYKCNEEEINNSLIYFVFYYNEENIQDFDDDKEFTVERVKFNPYLTNDNQGIFNIKLKTNQINLYKIPIISKEETQYNWFGYVLFTNCPYSVLFLNASFSSNITKYLSNRYIYYFSYNEYEKDDIDDIEVEIYELLFVIYNPDNYERNINLEFRFKNPDENENYNSVNMDYFINKYYLNYDNFGFSHICDNEPGLFEIISNGINYIFIGNIEDIKGLSDFQYLGHYKYISDGLLYSPNKSFILLTTLIGGTISLSVSKIPLEEKGGEISDISFTYFKISQNNTLTFTPKYLNQSYIIKLFSKNNGTVIINNKNYYFSHNDLKIIEPDENFIIRAIDNNFDFGIKLKISDELIDYGEIGKDYVPTNNSNYKFVVYKIDAINNAIIDINLECPMEFEKCANFEIVSNINEIQKKRNKYNFEYLDLLPYKQNYNNNNWYLFFYLENLTNYNITIKTKYFKQIPTSHQNYIFNPVSILSNNTEFMNYYYFDSYQILNILPCNKYAYHGILHLKYGSAEYNQNNDIVSSAIKCKPYELIRLTLKNSYAFITSEIIDIQDYYGYIAENILLKSYFCFPINITHIRINMSHIILNTTKIEHNYTFMITYDNHKDEHLFDSLCNSVYYLFINTTELYEKKDIEIYHFTLKDIIEDPQENQSYYYVDLPFPTKINIYGSHIPLHLN
jgi:hypothetical protein